MKLMNFFTKKAENKKTGRFADFFLHASEEKKIKLFTKVAKQANEEQRKMFESATASR